MNFLDKIRNHAHSLKAELHALWLAARDPRTPVAARWLIVCVVVYALSPIDLIPDFIPVIGYLDDLILLPLGIALALRLIPSEVMTECRERARLGSFNIPEKWKTAAVISVVLIWLATIATIFWFLFHNPPRSRLS